MEDDRIALIDELLNVSKWNTLLTRVKEYFKPIKTLEDYRHMVTHWRMPKELKPFIDEWDEDEEQGRQMLNGANPMVFECCKTLPPYCRITNEHVKGLFKDGKTLEEEMKEGKIFIADYTEYTRGLPRNKRYHSDQSMYCADCLTLYYAPGDGRFLPIAIQLKPDDEEYVFTPNHDKYDWLLAKMFFRCSDCNMNQWIYHYLWGHAIVETAATAMFRCLSRTHPMYKLCRPHLQHVVAINQLSRDVLIFGDGISNYAKAINAATLVRVMFKVFDFNDLNLPKLLKKKGLDSDKLQNYHFREDALLLWKAIEKYIGKVVQIYYETDEDVESDEQLQEWIRDMAYEGLGWMDDNPRGCPTSLTSICELVQFITTCVYAGSVHHSASHNPSIDIYKFAPNAPGGLRMPVHKRGEGSMERILNSLPDGDMIAIQHASSFVLSEPVEDETRLGEFPMQLFTEEEPKKVLQEFGEDINTISEKIKERNKSLKYPYEYILPENVPVGVTR